MSKFHFVMPASTADTLAGSPVASFAGTGTITDTVCFSKYKTAYFIFNWGVGTTETLTLTVIPITAPAGSTTTAIPFQWMKVTSTDTNTAWAWATSNSMLTIAGSDQMYLLKVSADDMPQHSTTGVTYEYCYVNVAVTVDDDLIGGCIIMMADPRYDEAVTDTVTT